MTTMRRLAALAALISLMAGLTSPAAAGLVIDQENTTGATEYSFTGFGDAGPGQSFVPASGAIDFATFDLAASSAASYRVDVLQGNGLSGTLLGSSTASVVPAGAAAPVEFDFAAVIPLAAGSGYTLRLSRVSGANPTLLIRVGTTGPYPNGNLFAPDGPGLNNYDAVFSEGIRASIAPAPEPSTLALAGMGLIVGLGYGWRRQRAATA